MQKVLFALALLVPTSNANNVNVANTANIPSSNLRHILTTPTNNHASLAAEYHRRVLSAALETVLDSKNDDDTSDNSHTLQFNDDDVSEKKLESTESGSSVDANPDETSGGNQNDGECVVIDECAYCSDYKNDASEKCQVTGRRERIECIGLNSETKSEKKSETKYRSCRRTKKDEELLVMQLQFMCLLTSYFSLRSVRREKLKSVSLFDQRIVRRRPMIPVSSNNPKTYTDVQQVEKGSCRDTNMEDNVLHRVVSSDGIEKLANKV